MERLQGTQPRIIALAALLVAMALPLHAHATPITWRLVDVTYNDGGTASGSFVYDAALNLYSGISISTTAGSAFAGASYFDLLPGKTSNAMRTQLTRSAAEYKDFDPFVQFDLLAAMTELGGSIDLDVSATVEPFFHSQEGTVFRVNESPTQGSLAVRRHAISGYITSESLAVAEPGTLALLVAGLAGLAVLRQRRKA